MSLPPMSLPPMTLPLLLSLTVALALACGSAAQAPTPPWLNGQSRAEDIAISLVTIGPGDAVPEYFGHVAVEVHDRRRQFAALYNFGAFDFSGEFLANFARGRLEFWLAVNPARPSYEWYAQQDRDVVLDELDLPPARALQLAKDLAVNALPENCRYRYHHYDDNCATRIADLLDKATDGEFLRACRGPARLTLREHTRRCTVHDPVMDWILVFAMNQQIDRPAIRKQELFLPVELAKAVRELQIDRDGAPHPLVRRKQIFHEAKRARFFPDTPPPRWLHALGAGLAFAALLMATARAPRLHGALVLLYGLVAGVMGLLLTAFATLSEHGVTHRNENMLLANPLTLGLVVTGCLLLFRHQRAARHNLRIWLVVALPGCLALLAKLLPSFGQDNAMVLALLLPMQLAGLWSALRLARAAQRGATPISTGA